MVKLSRLDKKQLSDNPVRRCNPDCYFFKGGGKGCRFFIEKKVKFDQSCLHDLHFLQRYANAFSTGDTKEIKDDAAKLTASIVMQIYRMLEQVNIEGVTVEEPILDSKGNPVWIPDPTWKVTDGGTRPMIVAMRKQDHPLIQRIIQLTRSMGINLDSFKLTPKSAEEKKMVSGHIIAENPELIEDILKKRRTTDDRFIEALKVGTRMTEEDPVFKKLVADGDIVK